MKRFIDWLRLDKRQQTIAGDEDQGDVKPEQKTEGERSDDSSFSCSWADQTDSSIFDTGSLTIEKSDAASPAKNQSPDTTNSDNGVDPYNTGSFDTEK